MANIINSNSEDARRLMSRYTDAKCNWQNWRSIYDEAYAYAIPERDPWPEGVEEGRRKNIQVFDITAVNSARRLVSHLHSSLTPPGEQWFSLEAGEEIKDANERKLINTYLQLYTDIIFQMLNDSNFDLVINEFYQDLIIGTAGMMILESNDDRSPVRFKSVGVNTIYPEGDVYDNINTVWRDFFEIYGRDITQMWPRAKIPSSITTKMEGNPLAKFDFTEGVVFDPKTKTYRIVVITMDTNEFILDIETKSSPWIVGRWSKCSNEVGGRGPIIDALPTIRSLNALVEEIMRNVALSTSPPWMAASDGVFNPYLFQISPNKIIPISRQSMNEMPLKRLDVSGDVNMGNLEVNDMRIQIKDALFDNPIQPVNSPVPTATEIMVRQQQFMEEIGPAFGRISVEILPAIIKRTIFIGQRRGYLPAGLTIDNKKIAIKYKSPLVRGMALQKIQNLQNYVQIMQPILGQQFTLGTLNIAQLPQWLSDKLDVDESLVKTPDEIQLLVQKLMAASNPPPPATTQPNPNEPLATQVNTQKALGTTANG